MTTLVSLIGRSLPRSKRFIHTTAYALSAKPATDPPFINNNSNNNNNNNGSSGTTATGDELTTKSKQASTKTTPFTKGRKQYRKSKRHIPTVPESFYANNCIGHASIALEPIDPIYHFPDHVWQELKFSVQAGLAPKGGLAAFDHSDHITLNIPIKGATYLQDKVARQLAATMKSDLVIFDPQDFITLAQENSTNAMTLLPTLTKGNSSISTILSIQPDDIKSVSTTSTAVNELDQKYETSNTSSGNNGTEVWKVDITDDESVSNVLQILRNKDQLVSKAKNDVVKRYSSMFKKILQVQNTANTNMSSTISTTTATTATTTTTTTTISPSSETETITTQPSLANSAKIIYLRDYGEMQNMFGSLMLRALMMAVDDLRQTGQRLIVFSGYSPSLRKQEQQQRTQDKVSAGIYMDDVGDDDSNDLTDRQQQLAPDNYSYALQSDTIPLLNGMKCIHLTPPITSDEQGSNNSSVTTTNNNIMAGWEAKMKKDAAQRIGELNARQLLVVHQHKQVLGIKYNNNNNKTDHHDDQSYQQPFVQQLRERLTGINDELWSVDQVDRRVTVALGHALQENRDYVGIQDFVSANDIIEKGTSIYRQASELLASHRSTLALGKNGLVDFDVLKRACTSHENRLISRIVDPGKVQTSFKDVRAPSSTIETLQSLISLPLQRPDLFQHGILKRNFISGVLLFGPPGTGKTMLAKAVAKESGSRMLEIQASDVYEMYVGEGEKNVKAIFSLARKLSPCVIFIDEVDSLMNKRQSEATSNAHREIINQFMVEWDGLSSDNSGVMVMAATNRPFDLDDAVLRRLPRRVLVDLPKVEDRSEILKMLLKDEGLENEVSLTELAKATQHYSGSDLKNLCVTAALKSIQQPSSSNEKQSWARRLLQQGDFDEALKMVPASSSEDMDSLVEIRKWALKYGDGHQKKPKTSFGF